MDPDVRFGKPCLSGTRIDVDTVVAAVAAGESLYAVAKELPDSRSKSTPCWPTLPVAAHLPPAVARIRQRLTDRELAIS
jgi:hypothetical protein